MRRSFMLAGAAALMLVASIAGAHAQPMVQIGVLECRGGSSIGFIVGSVTNLGCVLRVAGLPDDLYVATIALQPLSLQGQIGLNVAAGLASLELRPGR